MLDRGFLKSRVVWGGLCVVFFRELIGVVWKGDNIVKWDYKKRGGWI